MLKLISKLFGQMKVRYCGYGGVSYMLLPSAPDCFVKKGGENIGYFQSMKISNNSLHVDHFAVDSSIAGEGKGERMLRDFAALVKVQDPSISKIIFDLGRSGSGKDIQKLAAARANLLQRVGAINIQTHQPNPWCLVVRATWNQANW